MEEEEKLMKDYTDKEEVVCIAAIASIATADRTAGEDELDFQEALAEAAELSHEQKMNIKQLVLDDYGNDLKALPDIVKNSQVKYSLSTYLVAFAQSDLVYSAEERTNIERIAWYLDINPALLYSTHHIVPSAANADLNE